jgi:Flp pilus assembly protein TadD
MARKLLRYSVLLFLLLGITGLTQSDSRAQSKESASKESRKEKADWQKNEPPRTGEEWFNRGYSFHNSDRYPDAIESFKRAADLGYRRATAMYNIACGYSLLNDKDNALVWLAKAFENGFDGANLLASDADLDPIRTDPRFKTFVAGIIARTPDESWRFDAKTDRLERANQDFQRLERESSTEGEEWAKAGLKLLLLRDVDRSIVALNRAVTYLNDDAGSAMYNLACAYALKGDEKTGIAWLEKAVNAGFDSPDKIKHDPDINRLRSNADFARIDKLSDTLSLSQFRQDDAYRGDKEDSNYSKQRWAPAITLYDAYVRNDPNSGRAWFNLAYALHYSHEHARAIEGFKQAMKLGYHKATSAYNVACGYAKLNQTEEAFAWLARAKAEGFKLGENLRWDPDLASLKSDPRFKRMVDAGYTKVKMKE